MTVIKLIELHLGMQVVCCREANLGAASKVEKCGELIELIL
jgi:hypothetical protein